MFKPSMISTDTQCICILIAHSLALYIAKPLLVSQKLLLSWNKNIFSPLALTKQRPTTSALSSFWEHIRRKQKQMRTCRKNECEKSGWIVYFTI